MQITIISLLSLSALAYLGVCTLLYTAQRSILYYPTPETHAPTEQLRIASGAEQLKVWRLNAGQPRAIIYFGGNAEDVHGNAQLFEQIFGDATVYLVNYRGYGGSTGSPTEDGLYRDAESVFDALTKVHSSIAIIGRSLGSGVATYLASVRDIEKLVLVTPFDSIENVASSRYPIFPMSLLMKDKFLSIDRVASIGSHTLLLVAEHDEIIPRKHSTALAAAFPPAQVDVHTINDTTHNTIDTAPEYRTLLEEFL